VADLLFAVEVVAVVAAAAVVGYLMKIMNFVAESYLN